MPDERSQSIIVAPNPSNLLYESKCSNGSLKTFSIETGQAVLCSSSQRHAGGSSGTQADTSYKYCLFAYIVLEESDFLLKLVPGLTRNDKV